MDGLAACSLDRELVCEYNSFFDEEIRSNLSIYSINWQTRPEKGWLASLLANEQVVGPLLMFLRNTEIGRREGAAQQELEWECRNDEEGESLLSD